MHLWQADFEQRQQEYTAGGLKVCFSNGVGKSRYSRREEWKQTVLTQRMQKYILKCTGTYIKYD